MVQSLQQSVTYTAEAAAPAGLQAARGHNKINMQLCDRSWVACMQTLLRKTPTLLTDVSGCLDCRGVDVVPEAVPLLLLLYNCPVVPSAVEAPVRAEQPVAAEHCTPPANFEATNTRHCNGIARA